MEIARAGHPKKLDSAAAMRMYTRGKCFHNNDRSGISLRHCLKRNDMEKIVEKLSGGEPLSVDQLLEYLPALKEVPRAQLDNFAKGAAVLHRYRKGEVVCEEGEFGSTAYYIVSGTVDIFIHNPLAHLRTRPSGNFLGRSLRRMRSFLTSDLEDRRAEAHQPQFIGIDADVDLPVH